MKSVLPAILNLLLTLPIALAQTTPAGSGHWEGAIQLPDREIKILIDLAQNEKGAWIGNIAIPEQHLAEFPLSKIAVKGAAVSFEMSGIPGDPVFHGDLSPDSKAMKGDFAQGGGSFSFQLKWTSEANVRIPEKSTPIGKEFQGTWEGVLNTPDGQQLRLLVKLANGADGTAVGTLNSLDQNTQDLPLSTITQKGSNLRLELKLVSGVFTGELKGEELAGEWTQGGASLPLTFKRPAAKTGK